MIGFVIIMQKKIIIDTDPGQDDAVAILLALASPNELNCLGITTVAGNVPLNLTSKNARIICELAGRSELKVFAGSDSPMFRPLITAEHVHGKTGLDGPILPEPKMSLQDKNGVDFLIETLESHEPGSITLCCLGPLTNIAIAIDKAPEIMTRAKEIVMMAGAYFEVGNITPAAEFNVFVDPEAAKIVLNSSVKKTFLPLDVTHKLLVTKAQIEAFESFGTRVGKVVSEMLQFSERFDKQKYGSDAAPLHDPSVIAYLLKPSLFSGRFVNVEIETESLLTLGMTVADWWGVSGREANANFIGDVDIEGFFNLLTERLAVL